MLSLIDVKYVVTIDYANEDVIQCRHDICALESEIQLVGMLQSCIEFVLALKKSQIQVTWDKDESGYDCWKMTIENWENNAKLLCYIYDIEGNSIAWQSEFVQVLKRIKPRPASLAIKLFPQILGDAPLEEDKSQISAWTRVYSPANPPAFPAKEVIYRNPQSVSDWFYGLLQRLRNDAVGASLFFKVTTYPMFEFQYPDGIPFSIEQQWLVEDTSAVVHV